MQEQEYQLTNASLHYVERQDGIAITGFAGLAGEVTVPEQIAGTQVTCIDKKAFLSKKNIRKMILPDSITEIGDWAFAYCDNLECVVLPKSQVRFGKSVFLECGRLRELVVPGKREGIAALLAAAVTTAGAHYLLDVEEAGSPEWLAKWDARMLAILNSPDTEGYSKQVLCGEEDYGSTDMSAYTGGRRRVKVRLALLRLLADTGLEENVRAKLEEYLKQYAKGCEQEETWKVVLEEHGEEQTYYQLLTKLGCVTRDNITDMLADMGENYPEMKAFLMRYQSESLGISDFFGELDL